MMYVILSNMVCANRPFLSKMGGMKYDSVDGMMYEVLAKSPKLLFSRV